MLQVYSKGSRIEVEGHDAEVALQCSAELKMGSTFGTESFEMN